MVEQSRETPVEHGSGEPVETKLLRIAAKAHREPKFQFTSLYHLMNEELLLECFRWLSGNKDRWDRRGDEYEYISSIERQRQSEEPRALVAHARF